MDLEKKEIRLLWEVRKSEGLRDIESVLDNGETLKFIVTKEGDIILGTGLHDGIAQENGLEYQDIEIAGQFSIRGGKIRWGYVDARERRTIIEEKIEEYLKNIGIIINP